MATHDLFFYGTLVHPKILARVTGHPGANLTTCDALLPNHTRHHVIGEGDFSLRISHCSAEADSRPYCRCADYPAVVSVSLGRTIIGRELTAEESRVQGSLVRGLTDEDIAYLDEFEGDEYIRSQVQVIPSLDPSVAPVTAETYIWIAPASRLTPTLWSFKEFLQQSAHRWVGESGENNEYYGEVDRRRAMGDQITPKEKEGQEFESFGKAFGKKWWNFQEGYTNLNHGSYGAAPRPVVDSFRAYQDESNSNPDRFMRMTYAPELFRLRGRLSDVINCDNSDIVMVANATSGVNAVLRSLTTQWQKGDILLYFSKTIYNACSASLQWIVDSHPHLSLSLLPVPVAYPLSHTALISALKSTIAAANQEGGGKIRLALFDAISSNPGVVVPWREIVSICREEGILSLVDAAHEIGQMPVDLRSSRPDFWVSNCHKWLMCHRGAALLYVDKKHQPLIHSIPTGHYYRTSPMTSQEFQNEFEWNGTIDYSAFLSIHAVLDFRSNICGGEKRITKYCHELAVKGGQVVAQGLATEVMQNQDPEKDGDLIANMFCFGEFLPLQVNVRLPLTAATDSDLTDSEQHGLLSKKLTWIHQQQLADGSTYLPGFIHDKKPWIRISAQVYNEIAEFEAIVPILGGLCERVNKGDWEKKDAEEVANEEGVDLVKE
ncbi:BQ2448_7724 [Microbotryum intermedium]|uniref:BQ2448_7724 protein n=1 Tax=Microbotryum intermedium TaxID=269621 RepID=A0A238FNE1_9BASI|nr:BQ2448_7724 [Microbotryum intermedium]